MIRRENSGRGRAGFTIIELIVVVVVVSILASIAIQNYRKVQVHAEAAAISHDLHLIEEAVIRGMLAGNLSPANAPRDLDGLRVLLPDEEEGVLQPRLPEGMSLNFSSTSPPHPALLLMVRGDTRHRPVLDALAAMRPMTAREVGVWVMEEVDYRTLTVQAPGGS